MSRSVAVVGMSMSLSFPCAEQTSNALDGATAQLGPNVAALVVELHSELGMPLEKVARVLPNDFGLSVTKGGLVQLLHRTADAVGPAYAARGEQVRRRDETGWRVNALRSWLWAFATPETTVYAICDGRGFEQAAAVLGSDFCGVLVRDGWAAYRGFENLPHQTRLGHYADIRIMPRSAPPTLLKATSVLRLSA